MSFRDPRALVALAPAYFASAVLLLASPLREFADESDNLLGGLLITHGARLYVDYFSSHMPFAYYVSAMPALLGARALPEFRLFSNALLIASTLLIIVAFRNRLPILTLGGWACLAVFAHTLQWGEMLTAGTLSAFGVLAAGLIFLTTPDLHFNRAQVLGLAGAVFVAIQSELFAFFPLVLLAGAFVGMRLRDVLICRISATQVGRETAAVAAALAAPHVVVIAVFWATGVLPDFVYDAYQFNQTAYSRFVMNATVIGMLHDWEAQYRTYLQLSITQPLGVEAALVIANLLATWVVLRWRGPVVAILYYAFLALTRVRNAEAYYLCSYFSIATSLTYAVASLRDRRARPDLLVGGGAAIVVVSFIVQVARTYDFSRPRPSSPMAPVVQALTDSGEQIFVAPYDPYIYLATGRMPASRYEFYFPWQAVDPRSATAVLNDLTSAKPPLIIFRRNEKVNGQWLTGEYAAPLFDALISQGYAPLDSSSALLADVLVRPDRLLAARARLVPELAGATTNPAQPRP